MHFMYGVTKDGSEEAVPLTAITSARYIAKNSSTAGDSSELQVYVSGNDMKFQYKAEKATMVWNEIKNLGVGA